VRPLCAFAIAQAGNVAEELATMRAILSRPDARAGELAAAINRAEAFLTDVRETLVHIGMERLEPESHGNRRAGGELELAGAADACPICEDGTPVMGSTDAARWSCGHWIRRRQ
jgi:hypothetical protein